MIEVLFHFSSIESKKSYPENCPPQTPATVSHFPPLRYVYIYLCRIIIVSFSRMLYRVQVLSFPRKRKKKINIHAHWRLLERTQTYTDALGRVTTIKNDKGRSKRVLENNRYIFVHAKIVRRKERRCFSSLLRSTETERKKRIKMLVKYSLTDSRILFKRGTFLRFARKEEERTRRGL